MASQQQAPLAPAPRLIAAVAFIDRRGSLLYFRSFPLGSAAGGDHDPSSLELAIFGAVDYINEKLAGTLAAPTPARPVAPGPRPGAPASNDLFLGLLVSASTACKVQAARCAVARYGAASPPAGFHHLLLRCSTPLPTVPDSPAHCARPQYPLGDLKLFGYAPSSGLKIIVAVKDVLLREDRVRETFRALHRCAPRAHARVRRSGGDAAAVCRRCW
jgi:hypothetical protein